MPIALERVNPKTVLYENVTDHEFANVVRGKNIRSVETDKGSYNARLRINFNDGSGLWVDEDRATGIIHLRYARSEAEQRRDGNL
jgi:hypothetical protein